MSDSDQSPIAMMSLPAYCTLHDVQRLLSAAGINLRIDHDPAAYLTAIDEGCREVDLYVGRLYPAEKLLGNPWVRHVTATMSAWWVCTYRGNPVPKGIQVRLDRYQKLLEGILSGLLQLPGVPPR